MLVLGGLALAGCGGAHSVVQSGSGAKVVPSGAGVLHTPQASKAAEIRAALEANYALFLIFPRSPGTKSCEIPTGGLAGAAFHGTCQTSVTYPSEHGLYPLADVRFRETWGKHHSSSWLVIVRWPAEKVDAMQTHGDVSPQMRYATEYKTPANQPFLDSAASYAEKVAGNAHVFTGVVIDDAANKTIVYLDHAPASILSKLRASHPGTYVIHNDAPRTLHAVMELQRSLHWTDWKKRGIDIVQSGPTQTGYLQVGVTTNVAKAQAAFDAKYGRGVIRVIHAEPAFPVSLTG